MMVGGDDEAVERLSPILDVLAPPPTEEHGPGWGHFGPTGAGHYVKMVHNGVEYGMMQAYAEGFALFDSCEYELDNAKIAHLWMQGSVVRSWLCELAALAFEQEGNDLDSIAPYVEDSGEGRWTVEDAIDKRVPMPVITDVAVRALHVARHGRLRREGERRAAQPVRRPRRARGRRGGPGPAARGVARWPSPSRSTQENPLVEGLERLPVHPTTMVIFGGTGDLAHRKLLPAIYNLAHEGALPERFNLIAVSRSEMSARRVPRRMARESIKQYSRREPDEQVLDKLLEQVRYVPGHVRRRQRLRAARGGSSRSSTRTPSIAFNRVFYLSTAPDVLRG